MWIVGGRQRRVNNLKQITMKEIKTVLEQIGFEKLPTLSSFVTIISGRPEFYFEPWVNKYNNFIRQPLVKGMFVPTDPEGNVLSDTENYNVGTVTHLRTLEQIKYKEAEERVLFSNAEILSLQIHEYKSHMDAFFKKFVNGEKTIEQAINSGVKLTLK